MGPHFAAAAAAAMDCGGGGLWPAALAAVGFAFSNAGFVAIQVGGWFFFFLWWP
jgi:hypothetical protein